MSFSALLTALNEYVGDAIVNDCGRPAPARQLSYHGRLPNDCCTDDGFLVTSWESGHPSVKFPASAANADNPCQGVPVFTVNVRYVVCWSIPEAGANGVEITDAQDVTWNNDALMLADVGDCVGRSLLRLACMTAPNDPHEHAVWHEVQGRSIRYVGVSPIVPLGGCAGLQWQLYVGVARGPASS